MLQQYSEEMNGFCPKCIFHVFVDIKCDTLPSMVPICGPFRAITRCHSCRENLRIDGSVFRAATRILDWKYTVLLTSGDFSFVMAWHSGNWTSDPWKGRCPPAQRVKINENHFQVLSKSWFRTEFNLSSPIRLELFIISTSLFIHICTLSSCNVRTSFAMLLLRGPKHQQVALIFQRQLTSASKISLVTFTKVPVLALYTLWSWCTSNVLFPPHPKQVVRGCSWDFHVYFQVKLLY